MPYHVLDVSSGAAALTISWICSAIARSEPSISAIFASRSLSPSALPERAALTSRLRSFIAARSSAVNVAFVRAVLLSAIANLLWVLEQPEDVAIGIGDGGDQAAVADVARGLPHCGAGSGHLGELRLDVGNVPVGHRRGHALRPAARHQPDVL